LLPPALNSVLLARRMPAPAIPLSVSLNLAAEAKLS
jgi:hypothetical protein